MAIPPKCPTCGTKLIKGTSGDCCPSCLFRLALEPTAHSVALAGELPVLEEHGDMIGRYKLLQQIGEGGCGVVYMAEQEVPVHRRVALKVIKLGMDTKSVVARFEAERQAMALMDHPNIAKVLDAGATQSGKPYFVMELVRGVKITEFCDQRNLSIRERLQLFVQVCNAIQHAHQKGVIHRDIKPSNVLVALNDGAPLPKVIDFGIAKATQQKLTDKTLFTAFEQFIGTPAYMSPEQAEMNVAGIDTRSDIYSLGVLLYELLTGQTLFDAHTTSVAGIDEIRRIIREQEPARPSTRLGAMANQELTTTSQHRQTEGLKLMHLLRRDLDWIVMKALEKDRTRRYETANALAMDIERHLNDEPVVARPPGNLYRFQKALRRNKLGFIATAVIIAVLFAGAIISSWQAVRARRAERTANEQRQMAEEARKHADQETIRARKSAAQADARYLFQERLYPAALAKVTESFHLGENWEDGLLLHNIASSARENWALTARLPLSEPVTLACVAAIQDEPCLIESVTGGLRVVDAHSGTILGSIALEQSAHYLFQGPESNSVVAIFDSSMSVFSLPSFKVMAEKHLPNPISCVTANEKNLLLILREGQVSLCDRMLTELDSFNWNENPAFKDLPVPRQVSLSPDGKVALFHAPGDKSPIFFWDRRHEPASFGATTERAGVTQFQFYDNTHFVVWFTFAGDTDQKSQIFLYDAAQTPPVEFASHPIPNDDLKTPLELQAWSSRKWGRDAEFPLIGLVGTSGLVLKGLGEAANDFVASDRFANLLPTEANSPKFLVADLGGGILVLRSHRDLLVFENSVSPWRGVTHDYCATAFRDGLLYANLNRAANSVRVFFVPFDPRQKSARFDLDWPTDGIWMPSAIAATPDASTVAIVAWESNPNGLSNVLLGRMRALIYHPGDLKRGFATWTNFNQFEIKTPNVRGMTSRFVTLDPDARTLLFWSAAATSAVRYDPQHGKSIGSLELGHIAAHSRDGRRIAAISAAGRLLVYELASGKTLLDLADRPATAICFSTDGSLLVAAQNNNLTIYDIMSGRVVSSIKSELLVLAYPSRGNRFLAFQPDSAGTGGSLVLADTVDARITDVLNRAGSSFTPAFFSDSGDQIAVTRNRAYSEVIRSLNPDELSTVLNSGLSETKEVRLLTHSNVVATQQQSTTLVQVALTSDIDLNALRADDIPTLLSHLGNEITAEGKVRDITFTSAGNAMHIEFAGPDDHGLLVWIPQTSYPKVMEVLGQNPGGVLKDQTIRVTGQLARYDGRHIAWKERLQITLNEASKLLLVSSNNQSAIVLPKPAVASPITAISRADTNVLSAEDIPALLARAGNEVTVEGQVADVSFTAAGNALNIVLRGPENRALIIWVPRSTYPKWAEALGRSPDVALKDQSIQVTGPLNFYGGALQTWKGRLQVTLKDPAKFSIVVTSSRLK